MIRILAGTGDFVTAAAWVKNRIMTQMQRQYESIVSSLLLNLRKVNIIDKGYKGSLG